MGTGYYRFLNCLFVVYKQIPVSTVHLRFMDGGQNPDPKGGFYRP